MNGQINTDNLNKGDLVLFNGVALFYQANVSVGELNDENLGLILKKIAFSQPENQENECEEVVHSELDLQEPKFVYTMLCKGAVVEVLDIDINQLV